MSDGPDDFFVVDAPIHMHHDVPRPNDLSPRKVADADRESSDIRAAASPISVKQLMIARDRTISPRISGADDPPRITTASRAVRSMCSIRGRSARGNRGGLSPSGGILQHGLRKNERSFALRNAAESRQMHGLSKRVGEIHLKAAKREQADGLGGLH